MDDWRAGDMRHIARRAQRRKIFEKYNTLSYFGSSGTRSPEIFKKNIKLCSTICDLSGARRTEDFLKNIVPCSTICGISGPFSSTPSSSFIQQAKLNNYLSVIGHISSVWQNLLMCFCHQHKH